MGRKIDVWFPAAEVSEKAARERAVISRQTPLNYLHVWWARRPLVASRAATLLTLVPEDTDEKTLRKILGLNAKDPWQTHPLRDPELKKKLKELYKKATGTETPHVVDPMAGGGSIPLEALRTGCKTTAIEYNPVAWLILKATLEYPIEYGGELLEEMRGFFTKVRDELIKRMEGFYGDNDRSHIWIKWIECPRCGLKIPCTPNYWLLRKSGKPEESLVILPEIPEDDNEVGFDVVKYSEVEGEFDPGDGTVNRGVVSCPRCGTTIQREQVHRLFQRQFEGEHGFVRAYLAAIVEGSGRKKEYRAVTERDLEYFERAREELLERWDDLTTEDLIPTEKIEPEFVKKQVWNYGVDRFYKLFNERQLLAHAELLSVIRELSEGLDDEYHEPLTVYTMIAFDKMINRNAICCRWNHHRGSVEAFFDQHAYAWSWDHGEMNVPAPEVGGWDWAAPSVLEAYEELVRLLRGVGCSPEVVLGDARDLSVLLEGEPDAIVVDPPYYDNVPYAELSDFFYVWLKRSPLSGLFPDVFLSELTPKEGEIVADPVKFGGKDKARREYERMLREFLEECRGVLGEDGRLTVMFTHRSMEAWDSLVRALRDAGFRVNSAWPVHTEAIHSLHQKDKAAVRYTLVLACEPRVGGPEGWWSEVRREVRDRVLEARERARRLGLPPVDELVVAFGAALGVYSGYEVVLDDESGGEVDPVRVLDEARRVLADAVVEEFDVGGLDERGAFYLLYRYYYGYPSRSGSPDWEEVRRLCLALGLDPEGLEGEGLLVRYRGRAYLATFEDREVVDPSASSVDGLHAALRAMKEGLEAVERVVEERPDLRLLARGLVSAGYERYGDVEGFPRELSNVVRLLGVLGEEVPDGQRRLDEWTG